MGMVRLAAAGWVAAVAALGRVAVDSYFFDRKDR